MNKNVLPELKELVSGKIKVVQAFYNFCKAQYQGEKNHGCQKSSGGRTTSKYGQVLTFAASPKDTEPGRLEILQECLK